VLAGTTIFSRLEEDDLADVERQFIARSCAAGSTVYRMGAPARELLLLAAGLVKLSRPACPGTEVVVDVVLPGTMFGALPCETHLVYNETAETLTDCCVLAIPAEQFKQLLDTYSTVAVGVVDSLGDHLSRARANLACLGRETVEQRLAGTLLALADRAGTDREGVVVLHLPLTRADLAAMARTTTESVSRTLSRWRRQGLVESGRRRVGLRDPGALREIADGWRSG
jgi:CRP-like cAMP-binding protein